MSAARARSRKKGARPSERLSERVSERAGDRPSARPRQTTAAAASSTEKGHTVNIGGVELSVRILFIVVIAILLVSLVLPTVFQWVRQEQDRRKIMAQLDEAKAQQAQVQQQIELWNNPDYIAAQARERLGYVMPGETQYSVVDPGPGYQDAAQVAAAQAKGPARPWIHNFVLLTALADSTEDTPATHEALRTPEPQAQSGADTPSSGESASTDGGQPVKDPAENTAEGENHDTGENPFEETGEGPAEGAAEGSE